MKFYISPPNSDGVITVKIKGQATQSQLISLIGSGARFLLTRHKYKMLIDIRKEVRKFNMMETAELVGHYPQFLRKYKIAIVDVPDNFEKLYMHQVMAYHRGFRMFGFSDYTEAVSWLNSSAESEIPECNVEYNCGCPAEA